MGRAGGGDEMGEVAAARWLVQRPVVEGDAEQDGEDEIERGEEVRCAVAGREVGGAEAGEVAGEEVRGPVAGVRGVMEAHVAVCPADEGCGAGDSVCASEWVLVGGGQICERLTRRS